MFESTLYLAILRDIVLFLGIVISWIYWRRRNREREAHIKDLETSLTGKDTNMNDFENRLQEQETELGSLNTQLSQREETVRGLTAQVKERDNSINALKVEVADLKKQSQGSTTRAKEAEAGAEDLKKSAQQLKNKIESLNAQLSGLTAQVKERDNSINVLKVGVADLEKKNKNSTTRARNAEARIVELEKSMKEKEQEAAALKARMQAMQDDFTCIVGIGPKVSAVLRSAGINTFAKLAAADAKRIRGVLEAEDPRLLRLTDPSAWPEQARMAAEGDWEALSALQGSPKRGRRA